MHVVPVPIQPALKFDPGDSFLYVFVCMYMYDLYLSVSERRSNISNRFLRSIECLSMFVLSSFVR